MAVITGCGPDQVSSENLYFAVGKGILNPSGTAGITMSASGFSFTGTQSLANGTAAAPSLNFTNSSTTGWYRAGAAQIGVAVAGVPGMVISAAEPTVAAAAATAGQALWIHATNGGDSTGVTNAGRGADFNIGAGDGGNAAGSGNGGDGGNVIFNVGSGGTTGSGTAGGVGNLIVSGPTTVGVPFLNLVSIQALADTDATLTAPQMKGGVATVATGATNRTKTTLTAAQMVAMLTGVQVGSMLTLSICNLKAANTVTVGLGSGVTAAGGTNLVVAAAAAATFGFIFTNVTASSEAVTVVRLAG